MLKLLLQPGHLLEKWGSVVEMHRQSEKSKGLVSFLLTRAKSTSTSRGHFLAKIVEMELVASSWARGRFT